jgi:hypothetical protein
MKKNGWYSRPIDKNRHWHYDWGSNGSMRRLCEEVCQWSQDFERLNTKAKCPKCLRKKARFGRAAELEKIGGGE